MWIPILYCRYRRTGLFFEVTLQPTFVDILIWKIISDGATNFNNIKLDFKSMEDEPDWIVVT